MFERIRQMVIKEFLQALRDPRMRFFLFVTPLLQLLIFAYVVTTDVNNVSTAWYDLDRSPETRELARRLESSGYFVIRYRPESPREIRDLLDKGKVLCAIQIDPKFGRDLRRGKAAPVQVIVDGTDSNTATVALSYVNKILLAYAIEMGGPAANAEISRIDFRTRIWYNPELKSRNFNVPGVIAAIIMLMCLLLTSMAVVREREVGTMEQLMVSPIRPIELILGKTIPFALIGLIEAALVTMLGVFWFNIPIKGAPPLLLLGTIVYLLSALGIGLFVSTVSKTQQQALMAAMLFYMPAMLLSGFLFPIENMPRIFQYFTYINPLRYFLVIIRGVFLKGSGIPLLWHQIAVLLVLGIVILAVSTSRFRKRLG